MPRRTSPFDIAQRFTGMKEIPGSEDNPQILAMLKLDMDWPEDDEVPWCSAFANYCTWILRLPRSKSLRARSWLEVGRAVDPADAQVGFDVVILKRGSGDQPGPEVIKAPGHVGFFAGWDLTDDDWQKNAVLLLGGNQGNTVSVRPYPRSRLLGIRRLT